jgi:DNA-binding XRE family transcriptional regulator
MTTTLRQKLASLPADRQEKIEARAQQLIAEEMSLQSLRRARQLTQEKVADLLKIRQENVSRIEKRTDLLLSTLRDYVQSMGGDLRLVVEFPDSSPIVLSGLGELEKENGKAEKSSTPKTSKRSKAVKRMTTDENAQSPPSRRSDRRHMSGAV